MNYLLLLNKKFILIIIFGLILLIIFFFIFQKNKNFQSNKITKLNITKSYDIIEPKFTINNNKKKIAITAKKGNFLTGNKILLKQNVLFQSNNFKIYSDDVIFNKNNQTAKSKKDSTFISDGTIIKSKGFDLIKQGNVIQFNGKTKIILSK